MKIRRLWFRRGVVMKWVIDRFEDNYAIIGCGDEYFNIPKDVLPEGASEGDILNITINTADTEAASVRVKDRLKKLFGE